MRHALIRLLLYLLDQRGSMRFRGKDVRELVREVREGFGGSPSLPLNSVQVNLNNNFKGYDNLRYIEGQGLLVGEDVKVVLDSNGGPGEHYVKKNSSTDYTEFYTGGELRYRF